MTHIYRSLLLLAVISPALNLTALAAHDNEDDEIKNPYEELYTRVNADLKEAQEQVQSLNDSIDSKNKKIKKLEKDVNDLEKKVTTLDTQIKASKQQLIDEQKNTKRLDNKKLNNCIARLRTDSTNLRARIDSLSGNLASSRLANDSLYRVIAELNEFKASYMSQLVTTADKWIKTPFDQVNHEALTADLKLMQKYSGQNNNVQEAADRLGKYVSYYDLWAEATACLNDPYDYKKITAILPQLKELQRNSGNIYSAEFKPLYIDLDAYGVRIEIFQDLINEIDKQIKDIPSHKAARPIVNATLNKLTDEIVEIRKIPWLSKQYDLYLKELDKDCTRHGRVHDMILKISTDNE